MLYVDFSNEANQFSGNVSAEYAADTGSYVPLSVSGVTPADATRAWVYVLLKGTGDSSGSGTVYVDNVNMKYGNDTAAPTVTLPTPALGAEGVVTNPVIQLYFNENVLAGPGYNGIMLKAGTVQVPMTASITGAFMTVVPARRLEPGTTYTLMVPAGAMQDPAGNRMAAYTSTFTTEENLLENNTFETYSGSGGIADGWGMVNNLDGSPEFDVAASPVFAGSRAQKMAGSGLAWNKMMGIFQVISVKAGQPFTFDAQMQTVELKEAKAMLYVDFSNEANQFSGNVSAEYAEDTGSYVPLSVSGVTPTDATRAWVYVLLKGTGDNSGSGTVYVDDVSLKYGP
jgi:hypothetical protein